MDHFHTCRYCEKTVRCSNVSCVENDICPGCEGEMLECLELEMSGGFDYENTFDFEDTQE